MNAKKRPTAADVAALAGVSRSTVSYILNGSGYHTFPEETKSKVRAAAASLGYTPQAAARALRKGQSGVVLLVLPDVPASSNFSTLISTLTDAVRRTGRSLTVLELRPENRLFDVLRDITPAVILEVLPLPAEDLSAAEAAGLPVLSLVDDIAALDLEAGRLQAEHLATLGHERIAVLSLEDAVARSFAEARLTGARSRAEELGLPPVKEVLLSGPPRGAGAQVEAFLRPLAERRSGVTAICCFNDTLGAIASTSALRLGLGVPASLSVIGIDDDPIAELIAPSLSTIAFDYIGTGARVEALIRVELDAFDGPVPEGAGEVALIRRASTAPPQAV